MKHISLRRSLQAVCLGVVAWLAVVADGGEIHDAVRSGNLSQVKSLLALDPRLAWAPDTNDVARELPLHIAAGRGWTNIIRYLLQEKAPVDGTNRWGQTPLHRPVWLGGWGENDGLKATVRLLLENGAEVDAEDQTGCTPLHYAAGAGLLGTATILLDHGASVNAGDGRDNGTPLIQAAKYGQEKMIGLLISRGADTGATGHDGATALSIAAYFGRTGAMRVLLSRGARIDAVDRNRVTALQYAVERGQTNAVELLLQRKANLDLEDAYGQTALGRCLAHSQEAFSGTIAGLLRMYGAQRTGSGKWRTGIHEAAALGRIDKVKELLQGDPALVNAIDSLFRETPLHAAARAGHVAVAEFLLTAGAGIDPQDSGGFTPLHNAARSGGPQMVTLLLARKANPNAVDGGKRTPLHHAAIGGNPVVVERLILAGVQTGAKDKDGLTALDFAKAMGNEGVVEVLSKHQTPDAIRI